MREYILDTSTMPPAFYPKGLNVNDMIDITSVGDNFRIFLDPVTGKIHDGSKYYEQHQNEQNA